jgi:hypothetical protein
MAWHGVQVFNHVLEPFPWRLTTIHELFHQQQKLSIEKNQNEGDK